VLKLFPTPICKFFGKNGIFKENFDFFGQKITNKLWSKRGKNKSFTEPLQEKYFFNQSLKHILYALLSYRSFYTWNSEN
jgi:hypothetical protein